MKKELEAMQQQLKVQVKKHQQLEKEIREQKLKVIFLKQSNERQEKKIWQIKRYNRILEKNYFDLKKVKLEEQVRKGKQWLMRNDENKRILELCLG